LKRQELHLDGMITDRRNAYRAAGRKLGLSIRHLSHKGLNNREEDSDFPLRRRERVMQQFRLSGGCQRFVSAFSAIRNLFAPSASSTHALSRHIDRVQAFAHWNNATALSVCLFLSAGFS